MNVLEDCIIFLVWAACVLFSFYFKLKQSYSVWSFNENANFISFHGRSLPGCSEINKFIKHAKTYLFKNNKNTLKRQVLKATSSIRRLAVCITRHSS